MPGIIHIKSNIRSPNQAYTFTINTSDYCEKIGFGINRKIEIQNDYINWRNNNLIAKWKNIYYYKGKFTI